MNYPGAAAIAALTLLEAEVACARMRRARWPKDETIAYVLTDLHWGIYESADGKTECPQGFNEGNRSSSRSFFR